MLRGADELEALLEQARSARGVGLEPPARGAGPASRTWLERMADALGVAPPAPVEWIAERWRRGRLERRWRRLRELGMEIGVGVNLPLSTWIDTSHCHLISIGDNCGFGEGCLILAHDALANEFLDATRVARVTIHASCHFGARAVILPGVEIGPRTIVGAASVVTRSLPANVVAVGNPARVVCTLEEFLARRRAALANAPTFRFEEWDTEVLSPSERGRMRERLAGTGGYVVGGYRAAREVPGVAFRTRPAGKPGA